MNVFPVPISPTTVVPLWDRRERAAPLMASLLGSQGSSEKIGQHVTGLRGPVEGRVGLHHPLGDGVSVGVYELSEIHSFLL